jgi:hypothetical protein
MNPIRLGMITDWLDTCMVQVLQQLVSAAITKHEKIFLAGDIK